MAGAANASRSLLLRWAPIAIAVAYFVVMMPIGAQIILHYPDERHYAYGGARMVETGDWLIPQTPDGKVRLKKPIIPYWFSAAGFEVLGIGVPGFRLFWVLGASGLLLLTFSLARSLGASQPVAILAELMVAANPVFMRAATNSIPDIPLTLFVTASALGFVRILSARDAPASEGWAWLGWIGMALAVLTKGLLPLVLIAALIAYVALFDRAKLAAILEPAPIAAGACPRRRLVCLCCGKLSGSLRRPVLRRPDHRQCDEGTVLGACRPSGLRACRRLLVPRLAAPALVAGRAVAAPAFAERLALPGSAACAMVRRGGGGVRLQ